ncbi:N-acetylmuramoyl-L-alanine amidase [Oharaeibacter diazotrophicus]|uniref:N-acetylmuramoyl-L-alanine amidase n=1 Tax=Oharaeibacter diazotrophicus TaxID=1920512 RepID=UPI001FEDBDCD|nr:N-acetylmuramoyl-L-alanine amidase [Oharaeibacter diazotrophicus]GLS77725.1 N-acetylmuramoyl-L-alanine amidase [Oharaeibacter diazotrophicus]
MPARAETVPATAAAPDKAAAAYPVASDGRVVGDAARTRFVLDLDRAVDVAAFTLGDPYRVVIDLPQVRFSLPAGSGAEGRGLVSGWRYGLLAIGRSRIVIDATGPVKIDKSFVLPSVDGQPARLVVDLVGTTPEAFRDDLQRTAVEREVANDVPVAKGDRLPGPRPTGHDRPLVMLDPGHGGVDSGTISPSGALEKDVVLAFAFELEKKLEASGKVDVAMTRRDDTFVPLGDRVRIARDQAADLFVSIHADSVRQNDVRGATIYTLSDRASDREAAALADKENASDAVAGLDLDRQTDEVSDILIDLTRRETRNFSVSFANNLVSELSSTTRMIRNPHRFAGFRVLKAPDVPSVLVEIGYLSNEQDEKLLTSEEWRGRVTDAIGAAVTRFFGRKLAGVETTGSTN